MKKARNDMVLMEIDENYHLMTRTEYALLKGVTERTIGRYVQEGVISLINNKIDPEIADKELENYLTEPLGANRITQKDKQAGKKTKKKDIITFAEARTKEKKLKIKLLELDVAVKEGKLIQAEDVENAAFSAAREIRDKMLNIPDRVAAIIAAEPDESRVRDILTEHIEVELTSVLEGKFKIK